MVSNQLICSVLEHVDTFKGCFSLDQLHELRPDYNDFASSYIINTFESSLPRGGHWLVATFGRKGGHIELFDSLAEKDFIPPPILHILSKFGKVVFNSQAIQHPMSDYCGFFCISRVISIYKKQQLGTFISKFNVDDLFGNDKIVQNNLLFYLDSLA